MHLVCGHNLTHAGDIYGVAHAHQTRQALGATGTGDQADIDLGQTEPSALCRKTPRTAQCDLQTATQHIAMHQGQKRGFGIFDCLDNIGQMRLCRGVVKFGHVAAGDKGFSCAVQNGQLLAVQFFNSIQQALAHRNRGCVDRRVVDAHPCDIVFECD